MSKQKFVERLGRKNSVKKYVYDLSKEDAQIIADMVGIKGHLKISFIKGRDNGNVIVAGDNGRGIGKQITIYENGSNTRIQEGQYEVADYCYQVLTKLIELGYSFHNIESI